MISIPAQLDRAYLMQVANEWYDNFYHYMTDECEVNHEFRVIVDHKRYKFSTRYEKLKFQVENEPEYLDFTSFHQNEIEGILHDIVYDKSQFVLADKDKMKELAKKQGQDWSYAIPILKPYLVSLYEDFTAIENNSYAILQKLNIRTCPYCNRNYTLTISRRSGKDFKTRAEFDHFFDKAQYPLLALSFFNLVPSCHTCNHGKLNDPAKLNPYFEGFSSRFAVVEYDADDNKDQNTYEKLNINEILHLQQTGDFSVAFPTATAEEKENINTFGLAKLYNNHKDYILEIIDKANAYNSIGAYNLINTFQGIGRTPLEVFDFVWGRNLTESEQLNRPLSKLTKDILEQLGIQM